MLSSLSGHLRKGTFLLILLFAMNANLSSQELIRIFAMDEPGGFTSDMLNQAVTEFKAQNPKYEVDLQIRLAEAYPEYIDVQLNQGNIPDIFFLRIYPEQILTWRDHNQLMDLRPYLRSSYFEVDSMIPQGPQGEIYAIPVGTPIVCSVLYANSDLLKSLGLEPPRNYQDLLAMVPVAESNQLDLVTINGSDDWSWGTCFLSAYAARFSEEPHGVQKIGLGEMSYHDTGFPEALYALRQWMNDGVFPEDVLQITYGDNLDRYIHGETLFMIQGQWAYNGFDEEVQSRTILAPLPMMNSENPQFQGSMPAAIDGGYSISRNALEDPRTARAAMEFLKLLYSQERLDQLVEERSITNSFLQNPGPGEARNRQNNPQARYYYGLPLVTPVYDSYTQIDSVNILNRGTQEILRGRNTIAEVIENADQAQREGNITPNQW